MIVEVHGHSFLSFIFLVGVLYPSWGGAGAAHRVHWMLKRSWVTSDQMCTDPGESPGLGEVTGWWACMAHRKMQTVRMWTQKWTEFLCHDKVLAEQVPFKWESAEFQTSGEVSHFWLAIFVGLYGTGVSLTHFVISLEIYWKINLPASALFLLWKGVIRHQWVCCQKVL